MRLPQHLWRFPTNEARQSLADRFDLPYTLQMQDWEWDVADSKRIKEFMEVYKSGELSEDERFALMETIIQSFADLEQPLDKNKEWQEVIKLIESNLDLHIYTVWYWSDEENNEPDDQWSVAPSMREILNEHRDNYA